MVEKQITIYTKKQEGIGEITFKKNFKSNYDLIETDYTYKFGKPIPSKESGGNIQICKDLSDDEYDFFVNVLNHNYYSADIDVLNIFGYKGLNFVDTELVVSDGKTFRHIGLLGVVDPYEEGSLCTIGTVKVLELKYALASLGYSLSTVTYKEHIYDLYETTKDSEWYNITPKNYKEKIENLPNEVKDLINSFFEFLN